MPVQKVFTEDKNNINVNQVNFSNVKEAKIRNRYNQVPHPTQDTTRESYKTQ